MKLFHKSMRPILPLLFYLLSCSKPNHVKIYKGEVVNQPDYCTSSAGYPFIIKYLNDSNNIDSFITITLPIPYRFLGTKIKFEMSALEPTDESILCVGPFSIPKQAIISNVSNQ